MKEFVEKLIGRLEEEKKYCSYHPHTRDEAINKAIEIVNQLAEEMGVSKMENTNADFIRKMNDEELAEFLYGVDHFVDDGQCIVCFEEIRLNDDKADILDWLQSEIIQVE